MLDVVYYHQFLIIISALSVVFYKTFLCRITEMFFLQIMCVVILYIWCAATNPGDPGIFKLSKYPKLYRNGEQMQENPDHDLYPGGRSLSDGCSAANNSEKLSTMFQEKHSTSRFTFSSLFILVCAPVSCLSERWFPSDDQSIEHHMSEEGMFFCSLCEVEVCYQLIHTKHYFLSAASTRPS